MRRWLLGGTVFMALFMGLNDPIALVCMCLFAVGGLVDMLGWFDYE